MLVILAVWRHAYKRLPFTYDPLYWGMIFPLGMYTTCRFRLMEITNLAFLQWILKYFVFIALVAWLLISLAMLQSL
jgi:tellurite resistance protein TehA-like permease